jgi:hypothetical protein
MALYILSVEFFILIIFFLPVGIGISILALLDVLPALVPLEVIDVHEAHIALLRVAAIVVRFLV